MILSISKSLWLLLGHKPQKFDELRSRFCRFENQKALRMLKQRRFS